MTEKNNKAKPHAKPIPNNIMQPDKRQEEFGGAKGKDPTRYGDWEKNGRAIDF